MGMSHAYGSADDRNEQESLATLEYALELGINFWDTADMYGKGTNEELLSKVLATKRSQVFLASHRGRGPDGRRGDPRRRRGPGRQRSHRR